MITFEFILYASFPRLASSPFLSLERILLLILWSNVCRTRKQPKPTPDISHPALRFSVPGCSYVWVVMADQLPLTQFPSIMPRAPIPAQLSHHPRLYHYPHRCALQSCFRPPTILPPISRQPGSSCPYITLLVRSSPSLCDVQVQPYGEFDL